MNDLEHEFIEGAARALFVSAWAEREENTCTSCGQEIGETADVCARVSLVKCVGRSFAGQKISDVAPDTPDYARLEAARLMGKVEQANRVTVTTIMAAAARADLERSWSRDDDKAVGEMVAAHGERGAAKLMAEAERDAQLTGDEAREFGSDIAMQAMGQGVSWFDDHAEFDLPARAEDIGRCECGLRKEAHSTASLMGRVLSAMRHLFRQCRSKFVVPHFEFTMFDLED